MYEIKAVMGMMFAVGIIYYTWKIAAALLTKERKTMRIYQIDDAEKVFGQAVVYTDHDGEIVKHVIDVHEDTDVTALAYDMLQRGEFNQ